MDDVSQTGGPHRSFGVPFERGRRRGAGCARPDLDAKDDGELARVEELVAEGQTEEATKTATFLTSRIDKAAAKGVLHKNNAAHKKSRVAHTMARLSS